MVLHGLPDDVGHLVVAAVVDGLHGVENTPLHGLQTVLDMGHGAFEDDIRCVIEEPVLVHACELAHPALLLRQTVVLAAPGRGGRRFGIVRIGCAGGCFGSPVADGSGRRGLPVELLFGMDSIFILRHQFWIMNCELWITKEPGPAPRGLPRCAGCRWWSPAARRCSCPCRTPAGRGWGRP